MTAEGDDIRARCLSVIMGALQEGPMIVGRLDGANLIIEALAADGLLRIHDSIEAQIRAVVFPDGEHRYLSTYCVHPDPERHGHCRLDSKCCGALCVCSCHKSQVAESETAE